MHSPFSELDHLANRVRRGERGAAVEFRRELEPTLVHIVGQTLYTGKAPTPIARFVLTRACQVPLPTEGSPEEKRQRYIRTLAGDVCDSILQQLRAEDPQQSRRLQDTVALGD